jgi:hypothetical protein
METCSRAEEGLTLEKDGWPPCDVELIDTADTAKPD